MDATFSILPLAYEAMEGIRAVHHELTLIALSDAVEQVGVLTAALRCIEALDDYDGIPIALEIVEKHDDVLRYNDSVLPLEAIVELGAVAEGTKGIESLIRRPERLTEEPLDSDPETVRAQLHRGNRGVQVLAAWLSEGGATPRYFEIVNGLIADDGDIEPIVTGLINTSSFLLNMFAANLGVSAEGLLTSLLDMYSGYSQTGD